MISNSAFKKIIELRHHFPKLDNRGVLLSKYDVAIIHNHPRDYGCPPSSKNFQILDLDFQNYELISSFEELWTIESKCPIDDVDSIKDHIHNLYRSAREINEEKFHDDEEIFSKTNELYGELILNYINNLNSNIKLTKRSFYNEFN